MCFRVMKTTNRTILDLSKVQHGSFWYVNQYGQVRYQIPLWSRKTIKGAESGEATTVRGEFIHEFKMALYHPDYPGESEIQRAQRLGIVDVWTPTVQFQLTANHSITYTGKKAVVMWKAWQERIFNKKNKS